MKTFKLLIFLIILVLSSQCIAGSYSWKAVWTVDSNDHLELIYERGDGSEELEIEGKKCLRPTSTFFHFKVSDDFAFEVDTDMTLEVEYYDDHKGSIYLQYDSFTDGQRNSYRDTHSVSLKNEKKWKTMTFDMPYSWLANGENKGADMRIAFFYSRVPISKVTLSVNGLADKTYSGQEDKIKALYNLNVDNEKNKTYGIFYKWKYDYQAYQKKFKVIKPESSDALQIVFGTASAAADKLENLLLIEQLDTKDEVAEYIKKLRSNSSKLDNCIKLLEARIKIYDFITVYGNDVFDWLYFSRPAIDNINAFHPWDTPSPAQVNTTAKVSLCKGEFEPYVIGLMSRKSADLINIKVSNLVNLNGKIIDANNVDIKIVKHWYQAGKMFETRGGRELVSELLVNDDKTLEADLINQVNILNFKDKLPDSKGLLPFALEALYSKLLWVTFKAPEKAVPGVYYGNITVSSKGLNDLNIPVELTVYDFELEENPVIASMYYHFTVKDLAGQDREAYINQLIDLKNHGLTNPKYDLTFEEEELALRQKYGVNMGPLLYSGGYNVNSYFNDIKAGVDINAIRKKVKKQIDEGDALAKKYGYNGSYIYAIDEADRDELVAEIPYFRLVGELGGKVNAATLNNFDNIATEDLHLPNYSGFPPREVVEKVHAAGNKILRYGSPQGGAEVPSLWRYRYGLLLWEMELDGGCTWAYRSAIGNIWDDFDGDGTYRDFVMTYPGVNGPIRTVQWEGYREACDDLKYMATLKKTLEKARKKKTKAAIVSEVDRWLEGQKWPPFDGSSFDKVNKWAIENNIQPFNGDNLNTVREKMVKYIMLLK